MDQLAQWIRNMADGNLDGASDGLVMAIFFVGVLIVLLSIVALVISICLAVSYTKYNKKQNSAGQTGEEIARRVLDDNGLTKIKVSKNGSFLFGNSYSHYFKKVRLRRRTWKKKSVSAMAMAVQKASLAVLDKEGDGDMKLRIALTPLIYFGPLAFVPLIVVGVLLDIFIFTASNGICTIVCAGIGLVVYLISFILSLAVLKTEKKAQDRAINIMRDKSIATEEEIEMCRKLFRLYNIEYVNNMVIALLELIYRILQLVAGVQANFSSNND